MATRSDAGYLYLIGAGDIFNLPVKVGISIDVSDRLATLQTASWLELKVHFQSELVPNVSYLEEWLHWRFGHLRLRGEWFNLSLEDYVSIVVLADSFTGLSEAKQRRLPKIRRKEMPHTPSALDRATAIVEHELDVMRQEKQEAELKVLTLEELQKRHILKQAKSWYG